MQRRLTRIVCTLGLLSLLPSTTQAIDIEALERAMASPQRPAADKERDASRKAPQVLDFMGVESGMTVLDINASVGW